MKTKTVRTKHDYKQLKHKAYNLIVIQGKSQKEASNILKVSTTSINKWFKGGKWEEKVDSSIELALNEERHLDKLTTLLIEINKINPKLLRNKLIVKLIGEGI